MKDQSARFMYFSDHYVGSTAYHCTVPLMHALEGAFMIMWANDTEDCRRGRYMYAIEPVDLEQEYQRFAAPLILTVHTMIEELAKYVLDLR
jgi:hypothetical protein